MNNNIFMQDYEKLFSKRRMDSYTSEQEYNKNLELIKFLTPRLCLFEVFVRNKILEHSSIANKTSFILMEIAKQKQLELKPLVFTDHSLQKLRDDTKEYFDGIQNKEELFQRIDGVLTYCQDFIENQELETDKIVSSQSLGFWASIISSKKKIQFLSDRDFLSNTSNFLDITPQNGLSIDDTISYIQTTDNKLDWVVLFLIKNLRNRAFHWENLLKVDNRGHSRISVKIKIPNHKRHTIISIKTNSIRDFTDFCLDACDNRLKQICGEIEK